ncbi:MAG: PASTA domain-containing protein, partial [Gemmatimonadota bacterium]
GPGVTGAELRAALADDGLFRWLCACAVYPELHWDLTARLGDLGEVGAHTLTERNVLRLVRLRWFRDGLMPNEIRGSLLDELARLDQGTGLDTEQAARQMLARLIEHEPIGLESVAGRLQRKELFQQRLYLYRDDPPARREALSALRDEVAEEEILRDVTVVRLLERSLPNRLALALPRWLREAVWPAGHPALGARRAVAAGLAAALATGAWVALPDLRPGSVRVSLATIVPGLRAAVLQPDDRADLGLTLIDSAGGPVGLAGVTFATSAPDVVTVDTSNGNQILRAGRSGSAVVTVDRGGVGVRIPVRVRPDSGLILLLTPGQFEQGVLGRLMSPEVPLPATRPMPSAANARPTKTPSSAGGQTRWTSCDPATVEIKTSTFGESWGVAEARRVGSAVVIGRAPGITLVRVIHVTHGSSNPLVREVENPIDPLTPDLAGIYPTLVAKASAMLALLQKDSTLRIRGVAELVSDPADPVARGARQTLPNDSWASKLLEDLVKMGVPRSRLDFQTRSAPATCGSIPLPAVPTAGQLNRMSFSVVRDSGSGAPTVSLEIAPAVLELAAGEERVLGIKPGPTAIEPDKVDWTTSDATVALVTGGKVLAVAGGTTTITARYQGQVGTAQVTVTDAAYPGVKVPAVSGRSISQATALLRKAGLSVGGIDTAVVLTCTVRPAQVTGTKPQEGAIVSAGGEVRLEVRPARDNRATVPNLVGRPLAIARGLLVDGCLTLGLVDSSEVRAARSQAQQQNQAARQVPVVVDQNPSAGDVVPIRSSVSIMLTEGSTGSAKTPATDDQAFVDRAVKTLRPNYVLNPKAPLSELGKGVPRSQVLSLLMGDPMFAKFERPDSWIDGVVQLILCRRVNAKELDTFRAEIKKLGDDGFVGQLVDSPEARSKRSSCLGERPVASAK